MFCRWSCVAVFLIFGTGNIVSPARILGFFPIPFKSHLFTYRPLMKELVNRGHNLDLYTIMPLEKSSANLKQCALEDLISLFEENWTVDPGLSMNAFTSTKLVYEMVEVFLGKQLWEDQTCVAELLKSNATYDIFITDTLSSELTFYLGHKFKALSVGLYIAPFVPFMNDIAGLPDNPSYMTSLSSPYLTGPLTYVQRLENVYTTLLTLAASYSEMVTKQQAIADKYIRYDGWETRPKITELISDTALFLVNTHVSTAPVYPLAPHVKEIGGLAVDPQPLPMDLQEFMDDAPDGIIYFSLGSVLDPEKMLAGGKFELFLQAFRKLRQKVMWKVAPGMPKVDDPKIKVQTWYPQQSILAHKNVVLFITHGGLQSSIETTSFGVPCVAIPAVFDQLRNAKFMESKGMAIILSFDNLTESSISWSINEILTNPKYAEAAQKQKELFHDRPMKAVDEAVYWIEYVVRHGKVLQPASAHMPFYQVYLLDIWCTVIVAALVLLYIVKKCVSFLFSCMSGICSKKTTQQPSNASKKKKLN